MINGLEWDNKNLINELIKVNRIDISFVEKSVTILDLYSILSLYIYIYIYIYIPALKLDSFAARNTVYRYMEQQILYDGYIKTNFKFCTCKLAWFPKYRRIHAVVVGPGWEHFRMKLQQNYCHQSKNCRVEKLFEPLKTVHKWHIFFYELPISCWHPRLW